MRDLKHLKYFEDLLQEANNELIAKAKDEGKICAAFLCENTPEPLMNLGNAFGVRLFAPNTGSMDVATYYMTSLLCENSRALLERAIEGGFNFADCLVAPDGCTMINRAAENMELLHTMDEGKPNFFYENMEIALKADENGVNLMKLQCQNHILNPLHEKYGIDISDESIRKAVKEHNEICEIIQKLGEFRKEEFPKITAYEFAVFTLATYVCPKYLIKKKLQETLKEVEKREPDTTKYRARVVLTGSEIDDVLLIKLIEECGAYVCADRYCFGSFPGRIPIEINDDEDAFTQVCRHYVMKSQCPRYMDMPTVYGRKQYIADLAEEFKADGIIYEQVNFCDPWAYEKLLGSTMLEQDYGYPVLAVNRPYNIASSVGQMRTRVQAFVESIEIKKIQGGAK